MSSLHRQHLVHNDQQHHFQLHPIPPLYSPSTQHRHADITPPYNEAPMSGTFASSLDEDALNRRTLWKLDIILLPFLSLLFLLNSLDRSNIGNAETAHFTTDVGLEKKDLNTAVALFFAFFVTLQPIGAALGRRFGMPIWVPITMSLWGVCTALHVWVRSKWQLYTLRIIIGILEAGFYPTTVSYLSLFYTRYEFGRRLALFYGQYAVAGAVGGLLSFFVFSHFGGQPDSDGPAGISKDGWESWQVLFLLEGCGTIVVALIGFFWLPKSAGSAWFLSHEERKWADTRIQRDRDDVEHNEDMKPRSDEEGPEDEADEPHAHHHASESRGLLSSTQSLARSQMLTDSRGITAHDVLSSISSPKVYHLLLCNILSSIPVTSFSVFLPLVLAPFSPHPSTANLLTVPPYICGAVTLYAFTMWSDRRRERLLPILTSLILLLAGLLAVTTMPATKQWVIPRYISLCILLCGTFIASPLTVAWISGNTPSPGKRALMLGINGWGNLAGIFGTLIFAPRYGPSYTTSFWFATVCVAVAAAGYASFRVLLVRENARRVAWVHAAEADDVAAEEAEGRGGGDGGGGKDGMLLDVAAWVVERVGWKGARRWIDSVREDGREGDERWTFVYGL
ncbi:MFS general substrate transporter [Pseudovirgaria hyperparasitica]|uniref:MFS general substrate transporter n=1 Tax=Pseudovirgaria hyperparasitica TaxID=470096 RepID=A0A6A6W6T0_9PEZI|nr:MFS general substrate transporter [Pseudovirgaria hyperparasitica]KAF2757909.1 MFS general substrate transporter [Pseudovirgaria hyperparasitica]